MSNTQSPSLANAGQNLVGDKQIFGHPVPKVRPPLPPHQGNLMSHEEFLTRFGLESTSTTGEVTWVSVDKIKDRYDKLCKRFLTFTDEERREMESIVAHCTALNLPVQCANKTEDHDAEDQNTTKSRHRRPYKRKTVIPTATTISTPMTTSEVLPIVGPLPSSQDITGRGGHVSTAAAQIPLKRPLDHNNLVSGTDRAPPPAKRADQGNEKQAHATGIYIPPGAPTGAIKEIRRRVPENYVGSYPKFLAVEAREAYLQQLFGTDSKDLDVSSKLAGLIATRQHAHLLESGVPDSCLIPVVYGTCSLIFLLCLCIENRSLKFQPYDQVELLYREIEVVA